MKTLLFSLSLVLFLGCGAASGGDEQPSPEPSPEESIAKVQLLLFSAPWCGPCTKLQPALHAEITADATLKAGVDVTLYVETGLNSSTPPTEESAAAYKEKLGLSFFNVVPDPWRWTTFKKYLGSQLAIPGAAVLDSEGNVLKAFKPGSFSAKQIVTYLRSIIDEPVPACFAN